MELEELQREVKGAVAPVMTAFDEFKKTNDARLAEIESKGVPDPVTVAKLENVEKTLSSYEGLNQRLTAAEGKSKAFEEANEAQKAVIAKLEAKLGRPGALSSDDRKIEMKQRVNLWARASIAALTHGQLNDEQRKALADVDAEYKVLTISNDTTGGYLAVPEYVLEIIKAETLITPARQVARVRQTANKQLNIPRRTGQFAAVRVTEQGTRSETTGQTYGLEEITLPEMYAVVDISQENLEDSAFDLEMEIREEASTQFSVKEGAEFISGTGVGQMEGILTNASVSSSVTGNAATLSGDGFITVWGNVKTAYAANGKWLLNRLTLAAARQLKDGVGNYLWLPGLAQGVPNTILGSPYVECPDMPDVAANTYPVAYGDFNRGYVIGDRIAMSFTRDPFTQAASGNVRFWFRRRVGGKVVLPEAIRKLQCHT
jgi:HK97 family phage major capsid protein